MIRILIVDDVAICREPIAEALRHHGYDVACADNGSRALSHLRDQGADLVLLDYSMPDLDGLSVLRVMRRNPAMKDTPVIMLTERAERHFVTETAKCGISGYVLKSDFSLSYLIARVRACVGDEGGSPTLDPADEVQAAAGEGRKVASPASCAVQAAPLIGSWDNKRKVSIGIGAANSDAGNDLSTKFASLHDLAPIVSPEQLSQLIGDGIKLRPLGATARNVMAISANANCCVEDIAKAVNSDQVLALRILKLANSSAYSRGRPVMTVKDAIGRIGIQEVRSIVTALDVIQKYESVSSDLINPQLFWEHSIACGLIAASLNDHLTISTTDDFFLWGMIHDVGRLILLDRVPREYATVCATADALSAPLEFVEPRLLTYNHCEILERALLHWQFPRSFIEPVISHHRHAKQIRHLGSSYARVAAVIAIADALAHAMLLGSSGNDVIYPMDDLAELLGLNGDVLNGIISSVAMETKDLKVSMLSRSDICGWPDFASTVRKRATSPLRPLSLSLNPALDAYRVFFEQIASDDSQRPPNIAVIYARNEAEMPRLAAMLEDRLQSIGADELPILVVLGTGQPTREWSAINGRPCVTISAPSTIETLLRTVGQLTQ